VTLAIAPYTYLLTDQFRADNNLWQLYKMTSKPPGGIIFLQGLYSDESYHITKLTTELKSDETRRSNKILPRCLFWSADLWTYYLCFCH